MKKTLLVFSSYLAISALVMMAQTTQTATANETFDKSYIKVDTMRMFFENYRKDADLYLSREAFEGTPLSGKLLAECAKTTYDSTGVIVPLELALAQAQWESGMGLKGKSAKHNPYNVGEFDRGTMIKFKSTKKGVQAYFNLIAKDYLNHKTLDELLTNFVNVNGHRYASSKSYEEHIGGQCNYIQKWIDNNSDTINVQS